MPDSVSTQDPSLRGQSVAGNLTYLTSTLVAFWLAVFDKERRVDKRRIREVKHAAGIRYFDFTPVLIVVLASVIGARYLAIGTGGRSVLNEQRAPRARPQPCP